MTDEQQTSWTGERARKSARRFHDPERLANDEPLFASIEADLGGGGTIVDLGTGSGYLAIHLARRLPRAHIHAVDLSDEMLEQLRQRAVAEGVADRIELYRVPADTTGLDDRIADRVVATHLVHEVPDPAALVREAARLLEPGGRLIFRDYYRWLWWLVMRWHHPSTSHGPVGPGRIADLLRAAGLHEVNVERHRMTWTASARK